MRLLLSSFALLITLFCSAQAPQRMSFQAVLRDAADALIVNSAVGLRISVLQGSVNGNAVFVETHSAVTNSNGLVSFEIGGGTMQNGSIAAVDWANGPFFLKTETDPDGGTNYTITGTTQLLSVPYALHAANNTQGPPGPQGAQGPAGPPGVGACQVIRTGDGRVVVYNQSNAYGFGRNITSGSGWYSRSLDGPVVAALASDSAVVLYTATSAYGFGPNSTSGSNWYTQSLNGSVIGAAHASGRIVIYTGTNAYGFGYNSTSGSNWYSASLSSAPIGHVEAGNRIVVYTAASAHGFGFNGTSGSGWYNQSLSADPIGNIGTR
jgi:hypothetical protein